MTSLLSSREDLTVTVSPGSGIVSDTNAIVSRYCLNYGTSETKKFRKVSDKQVNYYLDYRTSETSEFRMYVRNTGTDGRVTCKGELLLDLRCLRNAMTRRIRFPVGELLLDLRYFRDSS